MENLWNPQTEKDFFISSLDKYSKPEQLFYTDNQDRYLAYWPKKYDGPKNTLQSRNSLIGNFTETWTTNLVQEAVKDLGYHAVQGAVCKELALSPRSNADVVISKKKGVQQKPEDILLIFEVKMSIVWNWQYKPENRELVNLGDYTTHQGNPGMLRSDSMLKAIGKSLNIRVSDPRANNVPIIVIGNTPINKSYYSKVDHLKEAGIVQGFWSVNPQPLDDEKDSIKNTKKNGFYRFDTADDFKNKVKSLLEEKLSFFSSMKSKKELGRIIQVANQKESLEEKAQEFLRLLNQ